VKYVHEDREAFGELIERTAERLDRERFTVEKDYWVTHALYALVQAGFIVWFKGGTSLSKGFSLIQRFSEDLDIKLEHPDIPEPSSWTKTTVAHTKNRGVFFTALLGHLAKLSPFTASREPILEDDGTARNLNVRLDWPGHINTQASNTPMKEYVLLEVGSTRVTPHVERDLGSWVHEELERVGHLGDYVDNRPRIRCLHPLVTLIEKLTILEKKVPDETVPADRFIRHYEDVAWIASAHLGGQLPEHQDCTDVPSLVTEMKRIKLSQLTAPDVAAFNLDAVPGERRAALDRAHAAIGRLFFGKRRDLDDCAEQIRTWIKEKVR
jgi:hypothetical protein